DVFRPHVRWCCGDIENGSTRLFGQIYPVSGAQRFHPTGILNKGTRGFFGFGTYGFCLAPPH
ncbi:hypothetical protein, partial [Shewanella algae]|uniref:hypothetical protein n=1 Tax=Shewanella algae TaxID=38313 RepID=UPI003003E27F